MIIDISTIKLVFGFARIGAPDPDSLEVVNVTAGAVLELLKALQTQAKTAQTTETPLTEEKLISILENLTETPASHQDYNSR